MALESFGGSLPDPVGGAANRGREDIERWWQPLRTATAALTGVWQRIFVPFGSIPVPLASFFQDLSNGGITCSKQDHFDMFSS